MPKIPRSPPTTGDSHSTKQKAELPRALSLSDPNVSSAVTATPNVTLRCLKRLRMGASPETETVENTTLTTDTFFASQHELVQLLTSWKTEQDTILSKLMADMTDLKDKCNEIKRTNSEIEKSMGFICSENEILKNKIYILEAEKLEDRNRIQSLETQLQEAQLTRRSSSIEIKNAPMKPHETTEDLFSITSKIADTVGMKIVPADVRDIYRLPCKPGNVRPIVTEFTSVATKYELLTKIRSFNRNRIVTEKLNALNKPIYIDELIPQSQKRLLYQAREYAKANGYEFCWYSNWKVLLRKDKDSKVITIKTEKCLNSLLKQK